MDPSLIFNSFHMYLDNHPRSEANIPMLKLATPKLKSNSCSGGWQCFIMAFALAMAIIYNGDHFLEVSLSAIYHFSSFLIAALIISAGYYCARIFLQFKEFELYWGAVFFLRSVHTFS